MVREVGLKPDYSIIRYAQCWEDADVLLAALDIQPDHVCLSIASAGDNTLAMLARGPRRIIALDLSPAQLACLALRVAAYRELNHSELLELIGSLPSHRRPLLYQRCRSQLTFDVRQFWDAHSDDISLGLGYAGKFERYLARFRRLALPLVHAPDLTSRLLEDSTPGEREELYRNCWDTWRWRLAFKLFFSRCVMGRLGRDPSFFRYVEGEVASRLLARTRHALTAMDPAANPYLQWLLTGRHLTALPYALRPENFEAIRSNLDRLEWHCQPLGQFLSSHRQTRIDRFNLSDVFEYMPTENYHCLLEKLAACASSGARLAYWNMLVPRRRPHHMADKLRPLSELAYHLHRNDKAFFYSDFVIEEVL